MNEDGDVVQASLEDSNMSNYGGKEMRDLRKQAAETEKEFKGAGAKPGLELWRVHNKRTKNDTPDFGVVKCDKSTQGDFYDGDSYIALNTYRAKDENGKLTDKLLWDVHFWLGDNSSQDEIGVAAYKTVELDDLLDDGPVQHRETQGSESQLFKSYFKEITYLEGGFASGFRSVKPEEYVPRLLMIRRSKKTTLSFQIPCSVHNMNHGDCFVLDAGRAVYLWVGEEANAFEKSKAANQQANIISARQGKAKKMNSVDDEFWKLLGGSLSDVKPSSQPYELPESRCGKEESLDPESLKLYRISDESGKVSMNKEHEGKVKWEMLDSNDVFLVHANVGIWIWVGSGASPSEKSKSITFADQYIKDNDLNPKLPVTRILQAKGQDKKDLLFGNMIEY